MKAGTLVRADQVRINHPQAHVHQIVGTWFNADHGHVYLTQCDRELRATAGAMRTTRPVTCDVCAGVPS